MKAALWLLALPVCGQTAFGAPQCAPEKITASDAEAGDQFGTAISIDGSLAVVGAPHDDDLGASSGAAYVFGLAGGSWVELQKLTAPDGETGDRFGLSVSIDGERIVVGAYLEDTGGVDAGAAYVFDRTFSGWELASKLVADDAEPGEYFGYSVAVVGDQAVVGARRENQMGVHAGAAYVFESTPTGWNQVDKLTAADGAAHDEFGWGVALTDDWLVVGSPDEDIGAESNAGAAYVFVASPFGWVLDQKLTAPQPMANDRLGRVVSTDGDLVLAGAQYVDANGSDSGLAHLFRRTATWQHEAALGEGVSLTGDQFGTSVSVSGSRCLVGAPRRDDLGASSGAAYLFEDSGTGWTLSHQYVAGDGASADELGRSTALSGEIALVGAQLHDPDALDAGGAVYFYRGAQPTVPYCMCSSGAPCGNSDDDAGCAHFAGTGSRLFSCGTTSVSADDLTLTVGGAPPNQFGIVYMGGAALTATPFGDGQRCVAPGTSSLFRYPVRFTGPGGAFSEGPGIAAFSQANFPPFGHVAAGDTWYFQGWFRDPLGRCGMGFNLSNALAATFVP